LEFLYNKTPYCQAKITLFEISLFRLFLKTALSVNVSLRGQMSGVRGQGSGASSQKTEVRGQASGIRSQRSGAREQRTEVRGQASG